MGHRKKGVLWVGGSSALARTYIEEMPLSTKLFIAARQQPTWGEPRMRTEEERTLASGNQRYVEFCQLDLTDENSVKALAKKVEGEIDTLILGARSSLVWGGSEHMRLTGNLELLLHLCINVGVSSVLHISSIAAANHIQEQQNVSESDPPPPLESYFAAYDISKRKAEDIVTNVCSARSTPFINLRIGAIFSNPWCIQTMSMRLQTWVSCYMRSCIDFNSSRNVAIAIDLLVARLRTKPASLRPLYYYTRPTCSGPVPLGQLLILFRAAHRVPFGGLWLPPGLISFAVACLSLLCAVLPLQSTPLHSVLYLIRVGQGNHSFCNDAFRADFPEISAREETIAECFARIRDRFPRPSLLGDRAPSSFRSAETLGFEPKSENSRAEG